MRKAIIISLIIIAIQFVAAFIFYPTMPDRIAVHWNINGEANGYGSKLIGLYLLPTIQLLILGLFMILPKIDPKHGIDKFRQVYDWFIVGFIVFMAYINGLSIAWNLGYMFDFNRMIAPVFGVAFYGLGVLLGKAKMNWFVGIRTPWTLSSEEVWNSTHRLGGKLFKICGVVSLLGLLFGGWYTFALAMGSVLVSTLYLVVYSYVEYEKLEKKADEKNNRN